MNTAFVALDRSGQIIAFVGAPNRVDAAIAFRLMGVKFVVIEKA